MDALRGVKLAAGGGGGCLRGPTQRRGLFNFVKSLVLLRLVRAFVCALLRPANRWLAPSYHIALYFLSCLTQPPCGFPYMYCRDFYSSALVSAAFVWLVFEDFQPTVFRIIIITSIAYHGRDTTLELSSFLTRQ